MPSPSMRGTGGGEGEVVVKTDAGDYTVEAGDFVTFKKGLKCVWDIKKGIRKHYNFR